MTRENIARKIDFVDSVMQSHFNDYGEETHRALQEAIDLILEQKTKTGHWEWLTEDKYRCSCCNHETRVDECMNEPMYDFCPFCGAKMESEGKE